MTIEELSKYNNIKTEIKQLNIDLIELKDISIGSVKITDMPRNFNDNDSVVEKLIFKIFKLEQKIQKKINELLNEKEKIENFLEQVEDDKTRIIIRARFIEGKSWYEIGEKLHFDRTTPYYRLKKYLKKMEEKEMIKKDKYKELLEIVNISEEEYNNLDFKEKQKYYKAKRKLCNVFFVSRDSNGKGITYRKSKEEQNKEEKN